MIDRLIEFSVRRRGWILAAGAIWALLGAWAALRTPIDALPDLSENQVIVFADWPGRGPEDVEQHVTRPLSLLLQGLDGLRVVRGSSDVGYSMLHLIFDDDASFDAARDRVQDRLNASPGDLPPGVTPRLAAEGIPTGQIYWYTVEGAGHDLGELRSIHDASIAPQLRSVRGVAEVASVGGFVREIHVSADPTELLAAGLTVSDIADAIAAARRPVGGHVVHKGNAEFVTSVAPSEEGIEGATKTLEQTILVNSRGEGIRLGDVAQVFLGAAPRRGVFEKDGNEVVGGVVHLRYGENTLEVTRRVKDKIRELSPGLPPGVRIVPCYDRTPLITGAVNTVGKALIEAILVATVCVVLVLRHARTSLVIALTLPLAVLGAFGGMWLLRTAGVADVQTNIMSLAGLVVSIGVLVDSSIVLSENVMFRLRRRFGDRPVTGDVSNTVIQACRTVGRPVFCSILIMLISFLPVFALGGIDGKMYAPLAWTKTLALVAAAVLAVTLVPALCATLIRGRIRDESESWVVRTVTQVYRPILDSLLDRPGPLVWILSATLIAAAAPRGNPTLFLAAVAAAVILAGLTAATTRGRAAAVGSLILLALVADSTMRPIGTEIRLPLDEGMVMDMPITVPRASIAQSADDLKARNMVLCRFPEVAMAVGKAGRADTPFDPAPLDMIETMVEFRPRDRWPKRLLGSADAERQTRAVWTGLVEAKLVTRPETDASLLAEANDAGLMRYDAIQREVSHLRIQQFLPSLASDLAGVLVEALGKRLHAAGRLTGPLSASDVSAIQQRLPADRVRDLANPPTEEIVAGIAEEAMRILRNEGLLRVSADASGIVHATLTPNDLAALQRAIDARREQRWDEFLADLNADLLRRAAPLWTRIAAEELIARTEVLDQPLADVLRQAYAARYASPKPNRAAAHHHGDFGGPPELPLIDPHPAFDTLLKRLSADFAGSLRLRSHTQQTLAGFGGEMDRALQMPGWTNVWTKPIQNRVDMLATGVNAEVGVRVLGRDLDTVVDASEKVAEVLRALPGAADVVADPIRGKGYLRITLDPARASERGVALGELTDLVEAALSGRIVAHEQIDSERLPIRLKLTSADALDEEAIRRLPVPARPPRTEAHEPTQPHAVTLDQVATVHVEEGPATVKSENGWLRNYVRLNVRDRDPAAFVEDAKRIVAAQVSLPSGVFLEWTGQYQHSLESRRRLLLLVPVVVGLILLILYATYRDWADALLMVLVVPGALAGGVLCQWLLGYPWSIAVGMGYIACFGMAAATSVVMLVYLREAVDRAGGFESLTEQGLRAAVLDGAVHRLRPKLLTEATTVFALAPMLWSTGVGTEIIRPMAAPVLGGILVADEVIDLLIPVLFYHVRRRRLARLRPSAAAPTEPLAAQPPELTV
jgi:copper/silver efflux system protein